LVDADSASSLRSCMKFFVATVCIMYFIACRLLTGYILAHEMMHAYLRLKGTSVVHVYFLSAASDYTDILVFLGHQTLVHLIILLSFVGRISNP
jgi:hypothetical protein